jgi:hypothetical protein
MLVISTAGIETIQHNAKLIVPLLKAKFFPAATKKMRCEKARIGRNFGYRMGSGRKRLPSNEAAAGVRSDSLAINENIEMQRYRVDYEQV